MTIYKPNNPDRKQEKKLVSDGTVVIDDKQLLTEKAKGVGDVSVTVFVRRHPITNTEVLRRRRCIRCVLILVALMLVIMIALTAAIFLQKHMVNRPYMGVCQVEYHVVDSTNQIIPQAQHGKETHGTFEESFEVDKANNQYERLQVPPVLDFRRSTVVHDFERNLTAIVDRDHGRCFILPLNRTTVQPPKSFLDLLQKFQSGYYLPNAEIVRENYKVQLPAIEDLEPLGVHIWNDCQYFDTYNLVKDEQPVATGRNKRFAKSCSMAGDGFCLGASSEMMRCITFTSCA